MMHIKYLRSYTRRLATQKLPQEKIKYTSTINLPKTAFPNYLNVAKRKDIENFLLEATFSKTYNYQEAHNKDPAFILHDGPPYANGDLHMGHAVNKILKDITLRKCLVNGRKVHYVPGWDCHGLPIELKAISSKSDGEISNVDPIELRVKCRKFAIDAMRRQKSDFESWGILSDWQNFNTYLTFDPNFINNEIHIFFELYENGLVFRDLKPVYWSPSSHTALAESELEYDENFVSPSLYVRFELNMPENFFGSESNVKTCYALVWTTTPWTLPSNQAICYNPSLEYCLVRLTKPNGVVLDNELYLIAKTLIDNFEAESSYRCSVVRFVKGSTLTHFTYKHPIRKDSYKNPFLDGSHVQDTKGTGLVHTAPSHGHDDFLICFKYKMPLTNLVNEKGQFNENAPEPLRNKDVLTDGNALVAKMLKSDIVYSDKIVHSYPIDWRTKKPVIIRASEQWFIDTAALKEKAVEEIKNIEVYPRVNAESSKKALTTQVMKRPYWCISRQRTWGVPIPAFYDKKTKKPFINAAIIERICDLLDAEGNIDFWWRMSTEEILSKELLEKLNVDANDLVKGTDIFDIWFDSGSTWCSVLPNEQIADMYLEGYDQFCGWFQSSLLISIALRNCAPYKSLFVHGFTVDEDGHKMSKSLGNVISPSEIVAQHGADTLRWWVASHGTQHMAITVSDNLTKQAAENVHKFRSIIRYMNGVIGKKTSDTPLSPVTSSRNNHLNKYLLSHLVDLDDEVTRFYNTYEYNRVASTLLSFMSNQLSATYVHLIKDRLYCGDNRDFSNVRFTLSKCYEILCKSLWPIVPFLIEESWSYYDPDMPFHEHVISLDPSWKNEEVVETVNTVLELKHLINQKTGTTNTWQLAINIKCKNEKCLNVLRKVQPNRDDHMSNSELTEILQVGSVTLNLTPFIGPHEKFDVFSAPLREKELCPRCRRFSISPIAKVCSRCLNVLRLKGRNVS